MKVAIFGKAKGTDFSIYVPTIFSLLEKHGCELMIYKSFCEPLTKMMNFKQSPEVFESSDDLRDNADVLISIGGDGTILDTITLVGDSGIPVMGINLGRLGFLSAVSKDDLVNAIEALVKGEYNIDSRTVLEVESNYPLQGDFNYALNELSVHRKDSPSLIVIHVYVDDQFLNSYWADGLLVATPTGSTGYSLSCQGPIVAPGSQSLLITPIASHNLTVRPIVIPDNSVVRLIVGGRDDFYTVGLDSRFSDVGSSTELTIKKANFKMNLIQLQNRDFYTNMREKLKWGVDIRN